MATTTLQERAKLAYNDATPIIDTLSIQARGSEKREVEDILGKISQPCNIDKALGFYRNCERARLAAAEALGWYPVPHEEGKRCKP